MWGSGSLPVSEWDFCEGVSFTCPPAHDFSNPSFFPASNPSLNLSTHSPVHPSSYLRTCISPPTNSPAQLIFSGSFSTLPPRFILHPSPTHPSTYLPTHVCTHLNIQNPPTHLLIHPSFIHPTLTYQLTIHPPFHKSIHPSIHPLIHLLPIRSFISSIYSIHSMYPFAHHPPSFFFSPV